MPPAIDPPLRRPRPAYARLRALSLVAVHLAILGHILHWRLNGRTLAPLELNELMYTLEAGIITAGFLFMVLVCASVLLFGRFFCSWGCHILALQDSCAWLMNRLSWRPRVVRSRGLALVPLGAMLYMFVWPQVQFLFLGRVRPALHTTGEESGWASFVTSDFWRNLPPPGVALLTFLLCGFVFVVLMGERAFCRYACPYGALFALLERFAPGRISKTGNCTACGLCTAACTSDVRVHEELAAHGQVVDSACLRDLDCLNACPDGAIGFRYRRPPGLGGKRQLRDTPVKPKRAMFTRGEELWMILAYVPIAWTLRGLYGRVPLLLSLALAGMAVYLGVIGWRLLLAPQVKLVRTPLKSGGRLNGKGRLVQLGCAALAALLLHSAAIRVQSRRGERAVAALGTGQDLQGLREGLEAYNFVEHWGLLPTHGLQRKRGLLQRARGNLLAAQGRYPAALSAYQLAVRELPADPVLHFNLGRLLSQAGRPGEAVGHYRESVRLQPEDPESRNNLAYELLGLGRPQEAEPHLRRALELDPSHANAHFLLGRLHYEAGRAPAAMESFRRAAALDRTLAQWLEEFEREDLEGGSPP